MARRSGSEGTFRALRERNARLFFAGLWVSQIGTWMQTIASALLVQRLAPAQWEGVLIGVTFAAQFVPMLLFGAWSGAFADQRNRWKVTVFAQSGMGVLAVVLAAMTFAGWATIPVVLVMNLLLGVVNTVDNPARRGVVTELVDPIDIPNALALNTATMTGSRAVGPALAALLVPTLGYGWCFMLNGISYVAIVGALLLMEPAKLRRTPPAPRGGTPVRDGLRFVRDDVVLRRVFIVMVVVSTFAFNSQVAIPLLVDERWHVSEAWFGILMAVFSAGSFVGSLVIASLPEVTERQYYAVIVVLVVTTFGVAFAPNVWWAAAFSIPMGVGAAGFLAIGNSLSQVRAPGEMRSRLLALVAVAFLGSTPIGSPITGIVGDLAGAEWSLAYGAVLTALAVGWGMWSSVRVPDPGPFAATAPSTLAN